MESFEERAARDSEHATLSTKLTVIAVLILLVVVTILGLEGKYLDVDQATQVSETAPTAVAIHAVANGR